MNRRFALTLTPDEYGALESLAGRLEIGKADWMRLIIRAMFAGHQIESALENGQTGMIRSQFAGFGYQVDSDRIKQLIQEGGQGLQKLMDKPEDYFQVLQVSSAPRKRKRKGVMSKKANAA